MKAESERIETSWFASNEWALPRSKEALLFTKPSSRKSLP